MRRVIALILVAAMLPACGGGPPIVTDPSAPRVRWEVQYHTPRPNNPEKFEYRNAMLVLDRRNQSLIVETDEIPLGDVVDVTYSFDKQPRAALALLVAWPLFFWKKKQHWLTVSSNEKSWVFKLHDRSYSNVLTTLERAGLEITYFSES